MSQEDTNLLIGRLEKGVEVLEKGLHTLEERHQDHTEAVLKALAEMRLEFMGEMKNMHDKLDSRTATLHQQIDEATNNHTALRLSVQKLATTVSVIVGVSLYVAKGVFDAAKEAFAQTFFGN